MDYYNAQFFQAKSHVKLSQEGKKFWTLIALPLVKNAEKIYRKKKGKISCVGNRVHVCGFTYTLYR